MESNLYGIPQDYENCVCEWPWNENPGTIFNPISKFNCVVVLY